MARVIVCNGLYAYGHFALAIENHLLAIGFFDRSKTKQRGIAASIGNFSLKWGQKTFSTSGESGNLWSSTLTQCQMGRDSFTYCMSISEEVGEKYLLTSKNDIHNDLYHYLMQHYKLPLLKDWMRPLLKFFTNEKVISQRYLRISKGKDNEERITLCLHGRDILLEELICYDFSTLTEEMLEEYVSLALKKRIIQITEYQMEPLEFKTFDDYITKYGVSLVDNLNKMINPLTDLKPNVESLALKTKSLFPQQAASVNGVLAMIDHNIKYAVLNMSMGTGKTLMAASAIESAAIRKWLRSHPGKTLRDAYEPGIINYRAIIMAPGHLVKKWAEEIEEEIPYAKATILQGGIQQLVELRKKGKKAHGKEFYILSKDFAKLDSWLSPIPTQVKRKPIALSICKDCLQEDEVIRIKKGKGGQGRCPTCNGTNFMPYQYLGKTPYKGLVCPGCGELLIRNRNYDPSAQDFNEKISDCVLTPKNFAAPKEENSVCYHCGMSLWGSNAAPIVHNGLPPKEPKWYKVTHYSNFTKKSKTSAFVLKGHESDYYSSCITTEGLAKASSSYGPRKLSPAKYIKKYLKGFFNFAVLDEAHKYLGDSAQGVAAHSLIKASDFTLALTGTISNGKAESFFNLFWMLEPTRMKQAGYTYSRKDMMKFCREYGCVETTYALGDNVDGYKNLMSRGRQLTPPRVMPGISPVIFGKFLMDRCLFLDLSDLSKYLPKFSETVHLLPVPSKMDYPYHNMLDVLSQESKNGTGMGILSVMLQFGLSYLDKPYGRSPIMSPYAKDVVIANTPNFEEYSDINCMTPKETDLVNTINQEISEGRNCFVYASYTGKPETNVTWRLKELIEKKCNLFGRVEIIQSNSPQPIKREEWFHKRAADGIKVFITNPSCVETGLDFAFKYNGHHYNYPTLIFYQTGYNLATIWQASRRAFRLNQKSECRNYYLAYENTLEAAALEIMAKKQIATAAIQGKFSTEGLSAMAKGVDTRTQLAAALSKNDMSSRASLENMFDALNKDVEIDDNYNSFVPSPTYYQLMEVTVEKESDDAFIISSFQGFWSKDVQGKDSFSAFADLFEEDSRKVEVLPDTKEEEPDIFAAFQMFSSFASFEVNEPQKPAESKKKPAKNNLSNQVNLFDFLAG